MLVERVGSDGSYAYVDQFRPKPLEFHGTRDYIDGVIFGIQLMGGPRFIPKMVEKEVDHAIQG